MRSLRECPSCRALLTAEQRSAPGFACPYCGRPIDEILDHDNPYAPPRSDGEDAAGPVQVPRDFVGKLMMAAALFLGQLPLLAALVLTVWIPGNLIIELIDANNPNPNPQNAMAIFQLRNLVEMVFGPIYAGGIITALAARMSGERLSFLEAIRAGLHHWGRLFLTRLVVGLVIGLGFLAFIIPGILFAIRYCLVDEVVVLEGEGVRVSRRRSTYLTRGRSLVIFLGGLLYLAAILTFSWLLNWALEFASPDGYPFLSAAGLCLIDVLTVFFTCFFFLIYWEARQDELERQAISSAKLSPDPEEMHHFE